MKDQRHLPLFPRSGPLEVVPINIPVPVHRKWNGNQHVTKATGRYSKLARAAYTSKTSTSYAATILFCNWIIHYGILSFLLTDHEPQFDAKLFLKSCHSLKVGYLGTTTHHPQANGRVKRFNRALVTRLPHYMFDYQKNRDRCVQPPAYVFNTPVNTSTRRYPLDLVLSR